MIVMFPAQAIRLGSHTWAEAVYWTVREIGAGVGAAGEQPGSSRARTDRKSRGYRMHLPLAEQGNEQIDPLLQTCP